MEKLPMCRICLVKNVRMFLVVNRNLHELYEKLTDIPFVTEDSRPILACFICCAKLKQCCRFLRTCLKAEELFTRMKNAEYEPNPLINQDYLERYSGFIKSPIVTISTVDDCQTKSITIKEELPAVYEGLEDIIEPKVEHQSDEQESENLDDSCRHVADIIPQHFETDSENDAPFVEIKTELEEVEEVSKKKRRAGEMKRPTVAKKPKLENRRPEQDDEITDEHPKKQKSDSKVIQSKIMKRHTRTQIRKKLYNCDVCQRSFSEKNDLIRHISRHIGEKPYKRDMFEHRFSQSGDLTNNIRIHTSKKPYKCDVCQRSFIRTDGLRTHILIHTGEKPYKCDVCDRGFTQKVHLTNHIRTHTGEKPYKCDICERSFSRNSDLRRHIRIHTGEKPYKCKVCQLSFSQIDGLKKHIRLHTGENPYNCDVCQRSFSLKIHLTNHIQVHSVNKAYKCDMCDRSFSEKINLKNHIRIHTGEKPYKCYICERSFSQSSSLTKHIRTHTGEKPYKCDVCQRSFSRNDHLAKHISRHIHTGE